MTTSPHTFHIPVMGTGHSADSPIRVAHLGISTVISLVDDLLLEKLREYYSTEYSIPYEPIPHDAEEGRAWRITAYLDMVGEIVAKNFSELKAARISNSQEKRRYFELLPSDSKLRKAYELYCKLENDTERSVLENELNSQMKAGSIDVNIMAKLDRLPYDRKGNPLDKDQSDALTALKGFAESRIESSLVLSAGFNPVLYAALSKYSDFYRNTEGQIRKKIILKVSDTRSAMIQAKFLAKRGIEVAEFRIESGLNCGGHTFPSDGRLLPSILAEFRDSRSKLGAQFQPMIKKYYEKNGLDFNADLIHPPKLTVQGGIGNYGEDLRLREQFGMDGTGWGTPFLLVPEATPVDDGTRKLLAEAKRDDVYLSDTSPFGIPFNNIHGSGSELWHTQRVEAGTPGSPCPKGFLRINTEFSHRPICTSSVQYLNAKLKSIDDSELTADKKKKARDTALVKQCICNHLGSPALIRLGLSTPEKSPQSICPGPNIAWFNRDYSLDEMVDHIYGRGASLVASDRPHMFAEEIMMYMDYFSSKAEECDSSSEASSLLKSFANIEEGMNYCLSVADNNPYGDENLQSIIDCVKAQRPRLVAMVEHLETQVG